MKPLAQVRIISVFNCIIGTAIDLFRNVTPPVTVLQMEFDDHDVFLHGPLFLADVWVQMVVPSLPALLANAARESLCDLSPVMGSLTLDNLGQDPILILGPAALGEVRAVRDLEPPCVTLDLRLALDLLADAVPRVLAIHADQLEEELILLRRPHTLEFRISLSLIILSLI